MVDLCKGVGKGGGALKPPQILTHVTLLQKNAEKQERKKQLSGYKHAVLHTKIEAQKCPNNYTNSAVITCNKLIGYTAHRQIVSSVLVDMQYRSVELAVCCCM